MSGPLLPDAVDAGKAAVDAEGCERGQVVGEVVIGEDLGVSVTGTRMSSICSTSAVAGSVGPQGDDARPVGSAYVSSLADLVRFEHRWTDCERVRGTRPYQRKLSDLVLLGGRDGGGILRYLICSQRILPTGS
jgi:hypothetical protein